MRMNEVHRAEQGWVKATTHLKGDHRIQPPKVVLISPIQHVGLG